MSNKSISDNIKLAIYRQEPTLFVASPFVAAGLILAGKKFVCKKLHVKAIKDLRTYLKDIENTYVSADKNFIRFNDLDRVIDGRQRPTTDTKDVKIRSKQIQTDIMRYTYSTKKRKDAIVVERLVSKKKGDNQYNFGIEINDPALKKYIDYYEASVELSFGVMSPEGRKWIESTHKEMAKVK